MTAGLTKILSRATLNELPVRSSLVALSQSESVFSFALALSIFALAVLPAETTAQSPGSSNQFSSEPNVIVCDEGNGCDHEFIDGVKYKILNSEGISVIVAIAKGKQAFRARVTVSNNSVAKFDVLPNLFRIDVIEPKAKTLAYALPEKFIKSAEHRAAWANAINAFGSGMASQNSTTTTNTSGNVSVYGSDGSSANGTYNGQSTSTTRIPDYAAQAQARENIRRRREAIRTMREQMEETSLKSNTLSNGSTVSGYVYFEGDKAAKNLVLVLPIAGKEYRFPFQYQK